MKFCMVALAIWMTAIHAAFAVERDDGTHVVLSFVWAMMAAMWIKQWADE